MNWKVYSFTAGPFRVNYSETDRMGHAYHAEYLVWFECARVELLRSVGQVYRDWEEKEGVYLPVRECAVRYRESALYDDLVVVDTRIARLTRASITFDYTLRRDGDAAILATGSTTHAFIDGDGRIARVADKLLPQFFS